CQQHNNYPWTF
nr:immunoglobulin light chain junction region [Macaca mulatta]MOV61379.1 immunoglobulin light chain junction region [Macaca mulatta]MOV61390.1 immunoglobulin light chain junction region [Macaca mulatta]MOV63057.1 immunoglobulin light chain junction region [Macaca mulatta]MOV63238.1 immunoglobulin light chain junction region [Macaca mulatta]